MLEEEKVTQGTAAPPPKQTSGWVMFFLTLALLCGFGGLGYGFMQSQQAVDADQQSIKMAAAMKEMQMQVSALSAKVLELSTPKPEPAAKAASVAAANPARAKRPAEDKRFKEIQAKLADHEKELTTTREEMERARTDLDGRLNSTRDELGGSIARTDSELALLKKRGERDYTEFTLGRSKELQRAGPISIALRKTDTKHKRYNLDLLVEDARLEKKNVNLYEPIWIHRADDPQPVQLVVYQISKNQVKGYVNAPKYRQSQLAPTTPSAPEPTLKPDEPPLY